MFNLATLLPSSSASSSAADGLFTPSSSPRLPYPFISHSPSSSSSSSDSSSSSSSACPSSSTPSHSTTPPPAPARHTTLFDLAFELAQLEAQRPLPRKRLARGEEGLRRLTGMVAGYGRRLTVPMGGIAPGREEVGEKEKEKEKEEEGSSGWVEEPEEMPFVLLPDSSEGEKPRPTPNAAPRSHPRLNLLRGPSRSPTSFSSSSTSSSVDSVDYAHSLIDDFFLTSLYKPLPLGASRMMGGLWGTEWGGGVGRKAAWRTG